MSNFDDAEDFWSGFESEEADNDKKFELLYKKFISAQKENKTIKLDEDEYVGLARYLYNHHDLDKSLIMIELGLEKFPYLAPLLINKITILIDQEKISEAEISLEKAKKIDPLEYYFYIFDVEIMILKHQFVDFDEKVKFVEAMFSNNIDNLLEFYYDLVELLEDYKYNDEAFYILLKIIKLDNNNEYGLTRINQFTEKCNKFLETIYFFKQLIEHNPYHVFSWIIIGLCHHNLKELNQAVEAFQYALDIDEHNVLCYNLLLQTFLELKQYSKAFEIYEEGLQKNSEIIFEKELVSSLFLKLKKFENARHVFLKDFNPQPDLRSIYELEKVADIYIKERNFNKSILFLNQAIKKNPFKQNLYFKVGLCFEKISQFSSAAENFKFSLSLKENNLKSWLHLISCYIEMEEYHKALACGILYCDKNKKLNSKIIFLLSAIYFKLKNEELGLNFFILGYKISKREIKIFYKYFPEGKKNNLLQNIISKIN